MINCLNCIHYKLIYQSDPKRVYDGCEKYDLYLKSEGKRLIPCRECSYNNYLSFKDVRKENKE